MKEFWEEAFRDKQEMWGWEPAQSTILTKDFFIAEGVKSVLIPGIGYGRNAQVFTESGMAVTGIEISPTAIELAKKHFGDALTIYRGSVTEMPFDTNLYDGIYCYGLIYLLDEAERAKLIADCYNQLQDGGVMVFTVITKGAKTYGQGTLVSADRFEMFGGVTIYFYDMAAVENEFKRYGLIEVTEVEESYPFYVVKCKKIVSYEYRQASASITC